KKILFSQAKEAFKKLSLVPESEIPDYILLDINMPEWDGDRFLEEYPKLLERLTKHPKIVIISSAITKVEIDKFSNHPLVSDFWNKPLKKEQFSELILAK